jgi:nucleoside-diphosphate-sugar epimerase
MVQIGDVVGRMEEWIERRDGGKYIAVTGMHGVMVNQLVDIVEEIAGIKLKRRYDLDAPKGVNGRNSENTRIQELLQWEPDISLRNGLEKTYRWIYDQYLARERGEAGVIRESFAASN